MTLKRKNPLYIGMWGSFDDEKWQRDLTSEIHGVELSMIPELELIETLQRLDGRPFGIHHPLKWQEKRFPEFLIHEERDEAVECAVRAIAEAATLGAEYILFHFPRPLFVPENFRLEYWGGCQENPVVDHDLMDLEEIEDDLWMVADRLDQAVQEHGMRVYLEHELLHPVFYNRLFPELFQRYPSLGLCLDTARLRLQEFCDANFDLDQFLKTMSPYLTHLHIADLIPGLVGGKRHLPILYGRSQILKDKEFSLVGIDLPRYMKHLQGEYGILFEHDSSNLRVDQLREIYQYTRKLLGDPKELSDK